MYTSVYVLLISTNAAQNYNPELNGKSSNFLIMTATLIKMKHQIT